MPDNPWSPTPEPEKPAIRLPDKSTHHGHGDLVIVDRTVLLDNNRVCVSQFGREIIVTFVATSREQADLAFVGAEHAAVEFFDKLVGRARFDK